LETRITAAGGGYIFNSTLGLWVPNSLGYNFGFAADSALNPAENAVMNGLGARPSMVGGNSG
jgi:hypothetical protein